MFVKAKLLVNTNFKGSFLQKGTETSVEESVAKRWVKNGIAIIVDAHKLDVENTSPYYGKKAIDLFKLCQERGILAEPKREPEYYIELLNEDDAAKQPLKQKS